VIFIVAQFLRHPPHEEAPKARRAKAGQRQYHDAGSAEDAAVLRALHHGSC
jgi:hypothetical protein